jgi:signal transduction histidine kinase
MVRAVGTVLPDGRLLLVGRNIEELINLRKVVARALDLGVIPAVLLSIIGGVYFSLRDVHRARRVYRALERIMDGNLSERLPASANGDDFDRLAASVNRVLDELQRMLYEFHTAIDHAIHALDQVFGVITALLRIGEIDSRHRRAGFAPVALPDLVREVGELYEPIAESRNIRFSVQAGVTASVQGDRELLVEALINLVDNAVKYTPSGGFVELSVASESAGTILRVRDSGVGISADERSSIMKPYYRSSTTRNLPGTGIGLSLVGAIIRLHDFTMSVRDASPGSVFEIHCYMLPLQPPIDRKPVVSKTLSAALVG